MVSISRTARREVGQGDSAGVTEDAPSMLRVETVRRPGRRRQRRRKEQNVIFVVFQYSVDARVSDGRDRMLARRGGKSESSSAGMTSPSDGPRALLAGAEQKSLVADHLRSSDYLSNIHALRKRLEKEHASLDVKLKSGAKDQLEATRDGLLNLQITRKDVSSIQEAFGQVEQLCGSSSGRSSAATRSFKVISELSLIHRQFVQTASSLEKLVQPCIFRSRRLPGRSATTVQ
ncbi:unnamed protein product [Tilletia controversa]|nr:unnamed protein product [Tilletia controversa]